MTSVHETHDETVSLIGEAVSEVTRRAIIPELKPFQSAMEVALKRLDDLADDLESAVAGTRKDRTDLATKAIALTDRQDAIAQEIQQLRGLLEERNRRGGGALRWLVLVLWLIVVGGLVTLLVVQQLNAARCGSRCW